MMTDGGCCPIGLEQMEGAVGVMEEGVWKMKEGLGFLRGGIGWQKRGVKRRREMEGGEQRVRWLFFVKEGRAKK